MERSSSSASRAPRGWTANSGLPVLDGWAPASKARKSRLSAASAGRLPVALTTTSGASIATRQRPSTYAVERGHDRLVGGPGRDVQQVTVGVQDRDAGGLLLAPGEVDADEVGAHPRGSSRARNSSVRCQAARDACGWCSTKSSLSKAWSAPSYSSNSTGVPPAVTASRIFSTVDGSR